ncbi:MAG: DVUA0089 family protein, partial [Planctomycetes bacterium]|nr:DVUA0089 family protein [Planctomycetota bacterium]
MRILACSSCLLLLPLALPGQTWSEFPDAGDLPGNAQAPVGTVSPLTAIVGNLVGATDVDMFLIEIADASSFSASTVGGATFDTQLWLFHTDGRGVAANDDSAASAQSALTAAMLPHPGRYLLAITGYDRDPIASGAQMWNDTPYNVERRPDGPRRGEALDGWSGSAVAGAYSIALTGCKNPGKQIVLPDNHHLTENAAMVPTGSSAWWQSNGGHFQVLYEASHFTNAGVYTGWLDRVLFRGEDGEPNAGGQQWANVTLRLGRTSLTPATLGTNFAANLAACDTLSPVVTFPTVTVARSVGSFPNNYNIVLDVFATLGGFWYDATGGNLLVDVTLPTAAVLPPTSGGVMPMQDTSGAAAFVRGSGLTAASAAAVTGTYSAFPPVVAFNIDSGVPPTPAIPATNESYGAACNGAASAFYQTFRNGQPFDLSGLVL